MAISFSSNSEYGFTFDYPADLKGKSIVDKVDHIRKNATEIKEDLTAALVGPDGTMTADAIANLEAKINSNVVWAEQKQRPDIIRVNKIAREIVTEQREALDARAEAAIENFSDLEVYPFIGVEPDPENVLGITVTDLNTPEATTAYIDTNREYLTAEITKIVEEHIAPRDMDTTHKIIYENLNRAHLDVGVDGKMLDTATFELNKIAMNVVLDQHEALAVKTAGLVTAVSLDSKIKIAAPNTDDPVRMIQRFALFAQKGENVELAGGKISAIDGLPGRDTAWSMTKMLNMNYDELRDLGPAENAAKMLSYKMEIDPAFRKNVLDGLKEHLNTDHVNDVAAFLKNQGVPAELVESNLAKAFTAYDAHLNTPTQVAEGKLQKTFNSPREDQATTAQKTPDNPEGVVVAALKGPFDS